MKKRRHDIQENIPELSIEKAYEILKNVFYACGMEPPSNCKKILNRKIKKCY